MFKKLQQRYFAHVPFLVYTDDPVSKSFETLSRIKVSTVEQISRNLARIYDSKGSAGYSKRVPSPYGISTNACDAASIAIQYSSWREIKFAPKIEDNYPIGEKLANFFLLLLTILNLKKFYLIIIHLFIHHSKIEGVPK